LRVGPTLMSGMLYPLREGFRYQVSPVLSIARGRARLASSFEHVIEEALGARRVAFGPPMVCPWVAAPVAGQLRVVAELLRGACPGLRGVALARRLLTDGDSPLYGRDVEALREELGRVRFSLCS